MHDCNQVIATVSVTIIAYSIAIEALAPNTIHRVVSEIQQQAKTAEKSKGY